MLEKPGVFAAFGRSRELVRGHGWPVFGTLIVLAWLIAIGVGIVAGIIVAAAGGGDVVTAIVNWLVGALTLPFTALVISVLYFRLKAARSEAAPADRAGRRAHRLGPAARDLALRNRGRRAPARRPAVTPTRRGRRSCRAVPSRGSPAPPPRPR